MKRVARLLLVVLLTCSLAHAQNKPTNAEGLPQWTLRRTLSGHTSSVHSVAFSPDGKTIASASWDRTIILWDAETGAKKLVLKHGYHPHRVVFSADGKFLYSSGGDGTIKQWNLQTGKARTLIARRNEIVNLALSSDGLLLACDCRTKAAEVLDAKTGARKFAAPHGDYVNAVALSQDSKLLAVAGGDKQSPVELWNVQTARMVRKFTGINYAGSVAFSPDSEILAVGSQIDENIKLFNTTTRELLQTLSKDHSSFSQLLFSPAGHLLAAKANITGWVYFYHLLEQRWSGALNTHNTIREIAFSRDGKLLTAASYDDQTVTIWSNPATATGK